MAAECRTMVQADLSDRQLAATRVFDAPREVVFEAWTHSQHIELWWGPRGFTTTTKSMDVRPGGQWRFVMHGPDGRGYPNLVTFTEVTPPQRLAYEHRGEADYDRVNFEVTVTFTDLGDQRTRLDMVMLFPTVEEKEFTVRNYGADEGLKQTMERLREFLAQQKRGAEPEGATSERKGERMLIKIVIAVAVVAVVLVIFIASRPSELRVARSATILAPVAEIFAQVNDFHRWEAWSPYEKLDPAMKRTFAGESAGRGAIYSWNGNNQVGEGTSTIVESRADELIRINLQFVRPFACNNTAEFTFEPRGDGTVVTWTLHGKNTFMGKAIGLVMSMDKMVGGQFEQGLAQLKTVAEAESLAPAPVAAQSSATPVSAAH